MKVVGIVGSPRRGGNSESLTKYTLDTIAEEGLKTELIALSDREVKPCTACMACRKEETCPIDDDLLPIYNSMKAADGIILATPVYFGSATAQIKALMDRAGYMSMPYRSFDGKVGGPLVVSHSTGHDFTFAQMMEWFHTLGFTVPGSNYWNITFGREEDKAGDNDEEGLRTARYFGKNMAYLVKKIHG